MTHTVMISNDVIELLDGIRFRPPSTLAVDHGEIDVPDLADCGWIAVHDAGSVVWLLGESSRSLVAVTGESIEQVGTLDRLDMADGYDPGGLHRIDVHRLADTDDVLLEHEFGLARLALAEREIAWEKIHGNITNRVVEIDEIDEIDEHGDGAAWLEGEYGRFGHRLTDGMFLLAPTGDR